MSFVCAAGASGKRCDVMFHARGESMAGTFLRLFFSVSSMFQVGRVLLFWVRSYGLCICFDNPQCIVCLNTLLRVVEARGLRTRWPMALHGQTLVHNS